jgi:hypothetical protein
VTPRRIALLAAALLGLVTATVAIVSTIDDPPSYAMHEHFHVELDLPPVETALWFAARYPEYFTSGEAGLGPWLDGLDPRDRDFVIAMGQTLTWAWIEHEVAGFDAREPSGVAREAITVIRLETLNQLDLNAEQYPDVEGIEFNAYLGDPEFAAGVFARLVRGVSNCEGQNHLLALLLDAALERDVVGWPAIDATMAGTGSGHELVQLRGPTLAQPIYVDAWSNLPAFTVDASLPGRAPLLEELGEAAVVPGVAGRAPLSKSVYAESTGTVVELLVKRDAPSKPVDLEVRAPALDEASLARVEDPWRVYLFARILDIYDDPRAAGLYRWVIERRCGDRLRAPVFVCAASTALLERLERSDGG